MATEVVMPQMGESIAEGTITKWLKSVGDKVERDEPLFEISTDKVDAEIPSPAAGTLTEIKHKEGETVEVNTVVAVLDGDGAKPEAAAPAPTEQPAATVEAAEAKEQETPPPAAAETPQAQAQPQPKSVEPPKPPPAETKPATPPPAVHKTEVKPLHRRDAAAPAPSPQPRGDGSTASAEDLRRTKSSPLVRKIAEEHGIDIGQLEGTGLSGRVTKNDILSFIESGAPAPEQRPPAQRASTEPGAPSQVAPQPSVGAPGTQQTTVLKPGAGDRLEQMSVMRKKIADHIIASRRTSAHVTTVYEIDMSKVAKLRDENRKAFQERTGTKLTFMPFIFKA